MSDIVTDLTLADKDTSRSCIFDFPDRPVRPDPPIDPTGGPNDEYPYDPVWDFPPLDPPVNVDPDDPNKDDPPPDPSSVPSTHWLHVFNVEPSLPIYELHGKPPHEIWMYRQVGLSANSRIGKLVCKRNVEEIDSTHLSGDIIKFWDQPKKTDYETYTPVSPDGISSLDPDGQHVMFYWFIFHWKFDGNLANSGMTMPGGYEPVIPVGEDAVVHPATPIWFPQVPSGYIEGGIKGIMVRNTKHTEVDVSVSVS